MGNLKIVSDGTCSKTTIIDESTGEEIKGVSKFEIVADARDGSRLVSGVLYVRRLKLDITMPGSQVIVKEGDNSCAVSGSDLVGGLAAPLVEASVSEEEGN